MSCDLTECVCVFYLIKRSRESFDCKSALPLTKTIRTLCIMLHQNEVRLVHRRTCRLNLDEEWIFGCQISPIYSSTLPHSSLPLTRFLSNSVCHIHTAAKTRCHSSYGYYRPYTMFTPDMTVVTSHHSTTAKSGPHWT